MADLWNIGTKEDPIIQGQDGLPYYHQSGGWIRYGSNSLSGSLIFNGCKCKCRSYLYYVNYIHLGSEKRKVFKNFSDITPSKYDLTSNSISGYVFRKSKLYCIPQYFPLGTFQSGVSQIPDLPYSYKRTTVNTTIPCPQYYKADAPFGPATTIRRYINTYESSDCGTQMGSGEIPSSYTGPVWYWARYFVGDLKEQEKQPYAYYIQGTGGRDVEFHPAAQVQPLDCHSARVLVAQTSPYDPNTDFDYSNSTMKQAAITAANAAMGNCVNWVLFAIEIPCCQLPPSGGWNNWSRATSQSTPSFVWGRGDGEGLQSWHSLQPVEVQNETSVTVYQWKYSSIGTQPSAPGAITTSPCNKICSYDYALDSIPGYTGPYVDCGSNSSCSSCPQKRPDNIMQDFPYFYKESDVVFPSFKVWRKYASNPDGPWEPQGDYLADWECLPQWDNQWVKQIKDDQDNVIAIDILVDVLDESDSQPSLQVQADRFGAQNPFQPADYQTGRNYWQVYFTCADTGFGMCSPPVMVQKKVRSSVWEKIAQKHKVCLDKWQLATHDNTFTSPPAAVPGQFVYTFRSPIDILYLCYNLQAGASSVTFTGQGQEAFSETVQFPKKQLQLSIATATPVKDSQTGSAATQLSYELTVSQRYSSNSFSDLDCYFRGIPSNGWYQEPRYADYHGQTLLNMKYWKGVYPQASLVSAHRDNQNILTPGRKNDVQDPICQLYYIAFKSRGWADVWTDINDGYCNHEGYIISSSGPQNQPIQIDTPTVNWEEQCLPPEGFGLVVYVIGPSIFPGVRFQSSGQQRVSIGEILVQLTAEDQAAWRSQYGDGVFATGFYQTGAGLPLVQEWTDSNGHAVLPSGVSQVIVTAPQGECATWSTSGWRLFLQFGDLTQGVSTGIAGINGQNGSISSKTVYGYFPMQFSTDSCYNDQPAKMSAAATSLPQNTSITQFVPATGMLVPDPNGSALGSLGTYSQNGVSNNSIWYSTISGQSYPGTAYWAFSYTANNIPVYAPASASQGCMIFSTQYIDVDVYTDSSDHRRYIRLGDLTGDGKAYIKSLISATPGSVSLPGVCYAAPYLGTGQYTSWDAARAWNNAGSPSQWLSRQATYTRTSSWDRLEIPEYGAVTSRRYRGTTMQTVILETDIADYYHNTVQYTSSYTSCVNQDPCQEGTGGFTSRGFTDDYGSLIRKGQGCAQDPDCNASYYLYFDYAPRVSYYGYGGYTVQIFQSEDYKLIDENCNGRVYISLPTPSPTTKPTVQITIPINKTSSFETHGRGSSGYVPYNYTTQHTYAFSGALTATVQIGYAPSSWFGL